MRFYCIESFECRACIVSCIRLPYHMPFEQLIMDRTEAFILMGMYYTRSQNHKTLASTLAASMFITHFPQTNSAQSTYSAIHLVWKWEQFSCVLFTFYLSLSVYCCCTNAFTQFVSLGFEMLHSIMLRSLHSIVIFYSNMGHMFGARMQFTQN